MLPNLLKKENGKFDDGEDWTAYLESIGDYAQTIDRDFLSQICLEHFDRFNECFPRFNLQNQKISRVHLTTATIYSDIRYDHNKIIDFWYSQMDKFLDGISQHRYPLLNYCGTEHKWPFPPIIIRHDFGVELGGKNLGNPYHLIEGTHRVSFINRLFELKLVEPDTIHEFIVLRSKQIRSSDYWPADQGAVNI